MEKRIYNYLIVSYYVAFVSFFILFYGAFELVKSSLFVVDKSYSIVLQSIGILYVLLSVPFALWFFQHKIKQIKNKNEEEKVKIYKRVALLRISLIAFGVVFNMALYCFLQNKSMFYCAAIAAIAFIFCKPQKAKIEQDLSETEKKDEV